KAGPAAADARRWPVVDLGGRQRFFVRRFMGPRAGQRKSEFTLGFDRRRHASDGKALPCRPFGAAIYNGPNICTLGAAAERDLGREGSQTEISRWQRASVRTCRRRIK